MATAYDHFQQGFLTKQLMTKKVADDYDAAQSPKNAQYKIPQLVRDAECHFGRFLKEDESNFIMQKEDVIFFWAHMRASMAILAAYDLAHATSDEKNNEFADLSTNQQLHEKT